jgi:hypothetical protein
MVLIPVRKVLTRRVLDSVLDCLFWTPFGLLNGGRADLGPWRRTAAAADGSRHGAVLRCAADKLVGPGVSDPVVSVRGYEG